MDVVQNKLDSLLVIAKGLEVYLHDIVFFTGTQCSDLLR
jgi:hypothetical protein